MRAPLFIAWCLSVGSCNLVGAPSSIAAPTPLAEDAPWPRVRATNGHTVTLHLPQVERWTSNWFRARAAVTVHLAQAKDEVVGVVWFEAQGSVDRSNRLVTLDRLEISKARFPEAADQGSNALAVVREVLPSGARTVSLDYLITALGFVQAAARQGPAGLRHAPPEIIWATNRTVLIVIDGEPVLRPIPGAALERVVNTPALLVRDQAAAKLYLAGNGQWFTAASIQGPWAVAQNPPAEVAALAPATNAPPARDNVPAPRIIVRTSPAELLMTGGLPDFRPIRGTALKYAADTDSHLFLHTAEGEAYLLLSGRWFKAKSLRGPWAHVAPRDLPPDFAKIPPDSPRAVVLASVPDTPQAELAVLANSVPTLATVSRRDARIQLAYDGEPKFKPIEGTPMSYALNAQLPVIRTGDNYYALDSGVWFRAALPAGPWELATEVPEEIYTIPPSSPVYYATYARVYQATDDNVEMGYTPGYQGAYEDEGTVVYGTGWNYEPWTGDEYYGWGWTWGYSYVYVPWYQWWVWRPWWNEPGGLRAALVENIYDRWQDRPGVTHHDRPATSPARPVSWSGIAGHPTLYGRFKGSGRPTPMTPPPNTLALNPYSRPPTPARPGEIPRGAQLLTAVRQTPQSGRDLYASPDGNVYWRKDDGWYRRQAGGGWNYAAPAQGKIAGGGGAQPSGAGSLYRPTASSVYKPTSASVYKPNASAVHRPTADSLYKPGADSLYRPTVPDTGLQPNAQEIAALERQYYARSLGQMRAQNWRPPRNGARPARPAGRRR
jgi:hypothetical protein